MELQLRPTIWRTARALANRKRLLLLKLLFEQSGKTVEQLAVCAGMKQCLTSLYLRQLQARGLAMVVREGRYVYYRVQANPSIPETSDLVRALRTVLIKRKWELDKVITVLTGFTHPRRVALIAEVHDDVRSRSELCSACDMSLRALDRHLRKLQDRGLVRPTDEAEANWRLLKPRDVLTRTLVACCR